MPPRRLSPEERFGRRIRGEVIRSQVEAGETDTQTAEALGMSRNTYVVNRRHNLETWKAVEIWRAARHFGWGPETINRIFERS